MLRDIFVAALLLIVVAAIVSILALPGWIVAVVAVLILVWFALALIESRSGRGL